MTTSGCVALKILPQRNECSTREFRILVRQGAEDEIMATEFHENALTTPSTILSATPSTIMSATRSTTRSVIRAGGLVVESINSDSIQFNYEIMQYIKIISLQIDGQIKSRSPVARRPRLPGLRFPTDYQ